MGEEDTSDNEFENLFRIVRDRFANRLTADELEQIKKDVKTFIDNSRELRSIRLSNSDEPFFIFKPYKVKR